MFADAKAYSGIAVKDINAARYFYADVLGLRTSDEYGLMWLHHLAGRDTLIYEQPTATPASYTVLNFAVDDIDTAVDHLRVRGVRFETFPELTQDANGVPRGRPLHWMVQRSLRERALDTSGARMSAVELRRGRSRFFCGLAGPPPLTLSSGYCTAAACTSPNGPTT
jgi:catechol 2,3-dioxygenase-like lactoylglutathione lyase family enzyme